MATDAIDGWPCATGNYGAPEVAFEWTAQVGGTVEFGLVDARPTELNHDLFVVASQDGVRAPAQCVAFGFNSVVFEARPGTTYFLVADGYFQDEGAFEAELSCR